MTDREKVNLTDSLKKLEAIAEWFEEQQDVDVEAGLSKVKDAAKLIKQSKARLAEIENEFETIEKDIAVGTTGASPSKPAGGDANITAIKEADEASMNLDDIPF